MEQGRRSAVRCCPLPFLSFFLPSSHTITLPLPSAPTPPNQNKNPHNQSKSSNVARREARAISPRSLTWDSGTGSAALSASKGASSVSFRPSSLLLLMPEGPGGRAAAGVAPSSSLCVGVWGWMGGMGGWVGG